MNSRGSGGWALLGLKVGRTKGKTGGAGLLTRPIQAKVVAHRTTRNSCSQSSPLAKAEHNQQLQFSPLGRHHTGTSKAVQSRRNPEAHQLTQVYRSCKKPQEPHRKFFGEFLSMESPQAELSTAGEGEPCEVNDD